MTRTPLTGRLPHYVAVCIRKFDEPRILETSRKLGILQHDPNNSRHPQGRRPGSRKLLWSLAAVSGSGDGEMVVNALNTHSYPDRGRYFATSAVRFYIDRGA